MSGVAGRQEEKFFAWKEPKTLLVTVLQHGDMQIVMAKDLHLAAPVLYQSVAWCTAH